MSLPRGTPGLDELDLLVSVAELGSLGAAARKHGITQPAASSRISVLERRLGLHVIERGPNGSVLTDAGGVVVAHARVVLAAAAALVDAAAELRSARSERLRIASSKTIADHRIPHWLAALRAARPRVGLALEVGNSCQVADLVRSGAADMGFVEGPRLPDGLAGRELGADDLVIVVAPAHPWTGRRRALTLAELAETALVWRESGSGTRDTVWEVLAEHGTPAAPAVEMGSAAAILAAVRGGVAPAVLSRLVAGPDLAAGRVREVPLAGSAVLSRTFRAVWRRGAPPEGSARLLVDFAVRIESARRPDGPGERDSAGNTPR
ncbi:LysR family transcriptional regulator [Nocardia sp. CA-145437]|uniref:LysR family transcriptional regulator n=1 Tax=Nocardia sp. CA-145437 TaxID=3239980 RepID=UPI003D951748